MTLRSIQARSPDKLKKKSITVQGFPHALQLVLLEAVPSIRELQFPEIDSEGDSEMEDPESEIERLWTLKLDLVWKIDGQSKSPVAFIVGHRDIIESTAWLEEDNDEFVDNVLHLIRKNHKFSASMFLGGLLPDESADERNDSSDIGSNDETFVEDHAVHPQTAPHCSRTVKDKGNVGINDALKQFVDMKVKRCENRVMKAIAESESRVIEMLTKAMSGAGRGKILRTEPSTSAPTTQDIGNGGTSRGNMKGLSQVEVLVGGAAAIIGSVLADINSPPQCVGEVQPTWHSSLARS